MGTHGSTARADYIAGLRQLADLLEQNEDLPLPSDGRGLPLAFNTWWDDASAREQMATFVRLMPGPKEKEVSDNYYTVTAKIAGLSVQMTAERNNVCERVVVGTETIEVAAKPAVEAHTVERELIEWRCTPLLADAEAAS